MEDFKGGMPPLKEDKFADVMLCVMSFIFIFGPIIFIRYS